MVKRRTKMNHLIEGHEDVMGMMYVMYMMNAVFQILCHRPLPRFDPTKVVLASNKICQNSPKQHSNKRRSNISAKTGRHV